MSKYVNVYGLIYVAVIMIPNVIFAMNCKDGFVNKYRNPAVEIMEQIGRFGSFICMIIILPRFYKEFWFENGKLIYIYIVWFLPCYSVLWRLACVLERKLRQKIIIFVCCTVTAVFGERYCDRISAIDFIFSDICIVSYMEKKDVRYSI